MKLGLSMDSGKVLEERYLMRGLYSLVNSLMILLIVEWKIIKVANNMRGFSKIIKEMEKVFLYIIIKYRYLQVC